MNVKCFHREILFATTLLFLFCSLPNWVEAQFISPGRLISAHGRIEGVNNCTSCHQLGQRGIRNSLCLDCHTPLRDRISRNAGFHATVRNQNCATCHKDHFGEEFNPIRFDTGNFDHRKTGYQLVGRHRQVDCRSCHNSSLIKDPAVRQFTSRSNHLNQTYLGLGDACIDCHGRDNPHGTVSESACVDCHSEAGWKTTKPFNHAETGFELDGSHRPLSCESCHKSSGQRSGGVLFSGLSDACSSCHQQDNRHGGQFNRTECSSCHKTSAWRDLNAFSHARTAFPLTGRHTRVDCESCHTRQGSVVTYRGIDHQSCASCHTDSHDGSLGTNCASCHSTSGWKQFDPDRFPVEDFPHETTGFVLVGKHADLPCESCHADQHSASVRLQFIDENTGATFPRLEHTACTSCHLDYHAGTISHSVANTDCTRCHSEAGWYPTSFDATRHDNETGFPLLGGHRVTPCIDCHGGGESRSSGFTIPQGELSCEQCHRSVDPHGGQFVTGPAPTSCRACHDTDNWNIRDRFDHATGTGFVLSGAHSEVACENCHGQTSDGTGKMVTQYRNTQSECETCHEKENPHLNQFADNTCDSCHDTIAFTIANFDHTRTRFPLEGVHKTVTCSMCHLTEKVADQAIIRFKPIDTSCEHCHAEN